MLQPGPMAKVPIGQADAGIPGLRAVYCSIDPATAILEVAVHKGFKALDTVAHVLTAMTITASSSVHIVDSVPNPNWLRPGIPSAG